MAASKRYLTLAVIFAIFCKVSSDCYYENVFGGQSYKYCTDSCCGTYTYRYCCSSYSYYDYYYDYYSYTYEMSTGEIVGAVIGSLFGLALTFTLTVVLCRLCCGVKRQTHPTTLVMPNQPPAGINVMHTNQTTNVQQQQAWHTHPNSVADPSPKGYAESNPVPVY